MYGYLMHHGVKGMRWGVRNYQNADGTLTAEGRARYGIDRKNGKRPNALTWGQGVKRLENEMKVARLKTAFGKGSIKQKAQNISQIHKDYKSQKAQINKEYDKKYGEGTGKRLEKNNKRIGAALTTAALVTAAASTIGALKSAGVIGKGQYSTNSVINNIKKTIYKSTPEYKKRAADLEKYLAEHYKP